MSADRAGAAGVRGRSGGLRVAFVEGLTIARAAFLSEAAALRIGVGAFTAAFGVSASCVDASGSLVAGAPRSAAVAGCDLRVDFGLGVRGLEGGVGLGTVVDSVSVH